MKLKKLTIVWAMLLFAYAVQAQTDSVEKRGFRKENVFVGGNFGIALGNYTLINLSPQVGYRFNKTIAAGVGLNLLYVSQKQRLNGQDYWKQVQGITGLNVFGRVYPVQNFMIQVQPEANYIFGKQIFYQPTRETYNLDAEIVPSLLLGGGLVLPNERGALIISVMYDILQNANSPYGNRPVTNIGYNINLGGR